MEISGNILLLLVIIVIVILFLAGNCSLNCSYQKNPVTATATATKCESMWCYGEGAPCTLSDGSPGRCNFVDKKCCPIDPKCESRMCEYEGSPCKLSDGSPGICKRGYCCPK